MKKYTIPLVILLFVGEIHAWPGWIPRPSRVWNSIVNGASDLWDNVEGFLVDPIVNLGQDSFDFVIRKLGLAPDVQAMLTGVIHTHIKEPWGVLATPADNADASSQFLVFSDPSTHEIVFQDSKHLSVVNIPGKGNKSIPTMGYYNGQDAMNVSFDTPRGIATDYNGTFWVSDSKNDRIVHFAYDRSQKGFRFLGALEGFHEPYSVSLSSGETPLGSDDLLYVANTAANSVCRIPARFMGNGQLDNLPGSLCRDVVGNTLFERPLAVAVENNAQENASGAFDIFYVAFRNNRIAKVRDNGTDFELLSLFDVGTEAGTVLTGLATDANGYLYAVDSLGSKVHYIQTQGNQLSEVFTFGEPGVGGTMTQTKFNSPKGVTTVGTDIFVSEKYTGKSGFQRFAAVPTLDRNRTGLTLPSESADVMHLNLTVSENARIRVELYLYENINTLTNPKLVFQKDIAEMPLLNAGLNEFDFPFQGNTGTYDGLSLPKNAVYRLTLKVFHPQDTSTPTDTYSPDIVLTVPSVRSAFQVRMKENATTEPNISKPQLILTNLSSSPIQGFTIRLWMNRAEMPSQSVVVDPYYTVPSPLTRSVGYHPRNPAIVYADFTYPSSYVLNPGQSTGDADFQVGIHFQNYYPGQWDRTNDFSWDGITSSYGATSNVTIIGSDGRILYGTWPEVLDPPAAPAPPPSQNPVLGFENVANWSAPQAALSLNTTTHTEGNASLSIAGGGWFPVHSTTMTTTSITGETTHLALDVFVPGSQPNPWWLGSIDLLANCPSANLNNAYVGHVELTPLPQGQFSTVTFTVPQEVLTALQGDHSDFSLEFDVNVNAGAPPLLFDYLRFVP